MRFNLSFDFRCFLNHFILLLMQSTLSWTACEMCYSDKLALVLCLLWVSAVLVLTATLSISSEIPESQGQIKECLILLDLFAPLKCTEVMFIYVQYVCKTICKEFLPHPDMQKAAEVSGMLRLHVKSHSCSPSRSLKRQHTDLVDTIVVIRHLHETVFSYSLHFFFFFWIDDFLWNTEKCCSRQFLISFGF